MSDGLAETDVENAELVVRFLTVFEIVSVAVFVIHVLPEHPFGQY